ncbi:MAG: DUF1385 domain-containing protein [Ruminococcaceae bacterium]|nr:DUF1385 domain-containing protein [Oscillospiraceae bacterium]
MSKKTQFKTTVGGQAVMEGVMMSGPAKWCLAVRTPEGEVVTELHDTRRRPWAKWPFIRGVVSFVNSLLMGYKTLMRSAELALGDELEAEEPSKFDKWVDRHFGEAGSKIIFGVSGVLGVVLAVVLFMFVPTAVVNLVDTYLVQLGWGKSVLEGVLKIAIFVGYLVLVRRLKEISRVFSYHGAEHKTVFCYESGDELTVENVRKHTRFHPRCGTSFLLIVLIISIILFSVVTWSDPFLRVALKILLLPVVMALAYEVIRLAGRYDNPVTRVISAPGLWLQRLTTNEPDDAMIEVAIAAIQPVLPEDPGEAKW